MQTKYIWKLKESAIYTVHSVCGFTSCRQYSQNSRILPFCRLCGDQAWHQYTSKWKFHNNHHGDALLVICLPDVWQTNIWININYFQTQTGSATYMIDNQLGNAWQFFVIAGAHLRVGEISRWFLIHESDFVLINVGLIEWYVIGIRFQTYNLSWFIHNQALYIDGNVGNPTNMWVSVVEKWGWFRLQSIFVYPCVKHLTQLGSRLVTIFPCVWLKKNCHLNVIVNAHPGETLKVTFNTSRGTGQHLIVELNTLLLLDTINKQSGVDQSEGLLTFDITTNQNGH